MARHETGGSQPYARSDDYIDHLVHLLREGMLCESMSEQDDEKHLVRARCMLPMPCGLVLRGSGQQPGQSSS